MRPQPTNNTITRRAAGDIDYSEVAGQGVTLTRVGGIAYSGGITYLSGYSQNNGYIYAYTGGNRTTSRDMNLGTTNNRPQGLYWDTTNNRLYIVFLNGIVQVRSTNTSSGYGTLLDTWTAAQTGLGDDDGFAIAGTATRIYLNHGPIGPVSSYNKSTKARVASEDIADLQTLGIDSSYGMDTDGTTMWFSSTRDDDIKAVTLSTKARDPDKDFSVMPQYMAQVFPIQLISV